MTSRPALLRAMLGAACLLLVASATAVEAHPGHSSGEAAASRSAHRHSDYKSGRRLQLSIPGQIVVYNHTRARVRPTIHHNRARILSRHFTTKPTGHARSHVRHPLRLGPGRYTVAAHVRFRPPIAHADAPHHRYGTTRSATLRRHVKIRWGGYRRHTVARRGVATLQLNTSGPWTLEWVASCRDSFPYFGGVATSDNHVSSFNGHVGGGRNTGHIRVPWSGAVTLHIYDAGCTWHLTELSRHPFRLS